MVAKSDTSLAGQVCEAPSRAIEPLRFAPGALVHEDEIARDLGISRAPQRLALHRQHLAILLALRAGNAERSEVLAR